MSDLPVRAVSWTITGRVQGVGFRWFVRKRAVRLGVSGWVRNQPDGSVHVFATGHDEQLAAFELELKKGPLAARVADVVSQAASLDTADSQNFEIR